MTFNVKFEECSKPFAAELITGDATFPLEIGSTGDTFVADEFETFVAVTGSIEWGACVYVDEPEQELVVCK